MQCGELPSRLGGKMRVNGCQSAAWLVAEYDARRRREIGVECLTRPAEDIVPGGRLAFAQSLGRACPIAYEIAACEFDDLIDDPRPIGIDAIDRRIRKPSERHRGGIDRFVLGPPFSSDSFCQIPAR